MWLTFPIFGSRFLEWSTVEWKYQVMVQWCWVIVDCPACASSEQEGQQVRHSHDDDPSGQLERCVLMIIVFFGCQN